MAIPVTPSLADTPRIQSINFVNGTPVTPLVAGVTLTTPTSATLITGLSQKVIIQRGTAALLVFLHGKNATVTAAATITISAYQGATSGALTTLFQDSVIVAPTGGTTVALDNVFVLPVTGSMWNTTIYISIAATASTGNFVLNAAATEPTTLYVAQV